MPIVFAPGHNDAYYVDWPIYTGSHNSVMYTLHKAGFQPHFFQPNWRQDDPTRWAIEMAECATKAAQEADGRVALAGFSCGALAAVLAADRLAQQSDLQVTGLVACSLTPWFGEKRVRRSLLVSPDGGLHERSVKLQANCCKLELPQLDCPVQLYVGTEELLTVRDVHEAALKAWPQAESIKPPVGHNIFSNPYLNAISANVGRLAISSTS